MYQKMMTHHNTVNETAKNETFLRIFDIDHGFCAILIDRSTVTMFDCGHSSDKVAPLDWLYALGYRCIDNLIISNYDQDHISDIEKLAVSNQYGFGLKNLIVNRSISVKDLKCLKLKNDQLSRQMQILLNIMSNNFSASYYDNLYCKNKYRCGLVFLPSVQFGGLYINYPYASDTNNLSLVSFIEMGNSLILYPGDLEKSGWDILLESLDFCELLKYVSIFIASHHGRENGYNEKIFDYCSPEIVIISDGKKTYDTQDHNLYSNHTVGIKIIDANLREKLSGISSTARLRGFHRSHKLYQLLQHFTNTNRKVLTTRKDGDITIENVDGLCNIKFGRRTNHCV